MAISPMADLIQRLRRAEHLRDEAGSTDAQLLEGFVSRHDGAALEALVRRHAPMVWGVCRRLLRNPSDAEDAFQATFLVLVRKAASVRPRGMVANWLYGVARQTALKARATAGTRTGRERQVAEMPEPAVADSARWDDVLPALDEEVSRLPDHYRAVVVLCDLEGKTRREAALHLGVPEGTVAGWVARARALLAKRLTHRGVTMASGAAAAVLLRDVAAAGVPDRVVASTIEAASLLAAGRAAGVSVTVAALTQGVVKTMLVSKLKATLSVVLVLGVLTTGFTLVTYRTALGQHGGEPPPEKPVEPPAKQELKVAAPVTQPGQKKDELTAWGKEEGGLQAGLGFRAGEMRAYTVGETVKLVVRVRNVGKEEVSFQYSRLFFIENPPAVTDKNGKAVFFKDASPQGPYKAENVTLAPGKEVELYELRVYLEPGNNKGIDVPRDSTLYNEGKFRLRYGRVLGDPAHSSVLIKTAPALKKLETGSLEVEVGAAPPPAVTITDVTLTDVDEAGGTISVAFGRKDSPTRLTNVPLAAGARLVASHVLPGSVNNLPFEWENLKRLKGKQVSIRVSTSAHGMSVVSIASGND